MKKYKEHISNIFNKYKNDLCILLGEFFLIIAITCVITITWQLLEIIMYNHISHRYIDDIISIVFGISVFFNFKDKVNNKIKHILLKLNLPKQQEVDNYFNLRKEYFKKVKTLETLKEQKENLSDLKEFYRLKKKLEGKNLI